MRRAAAVLCVVLLAGCGGYDPDDPLTPDLILRDKYAGMSCDEIGHSYRIEPGLDPEHDNDGDGIACEPESRDLPFGHTGDGFPEDKDGF